VSSTTPERFDSQAGIFDERTGLSPEIAAQVAAAIVDIAGVAAEDVVFEIGAGTGEIGLHLQRLARYIGIDRSAGMLDVFRNRLEPSERATIELIQSDADGAWPVGDGAVSAVFGSRVAHLLDPSHLGSELARALRPGGVFLVGRVVRDRQSPRARLRQQRQRILKSRGVQPGQVGQAEKLTEQLFERLASDGAELIPARPVAKWSVSTSPESVMESWAHRTSMGGVELAETDRAQILDQVREWATAEFGDLTEFHASEPCYTVRGIRIPGS